jgi:hypothetical protein
MPTQYDSGKAFEYAILAASYNYLSKFQSVTIVKNSTLENAEKHFSLFSDHQKDNFLKAANIVIIHITELEPRLLNSSSSSDILFLQLAPDAEGIKGDVRDILFIRSAQNWEIGISAKNNHKAVKHSRLSERIDFGREWLNIDCSSDYFLSIKGLFDELNHLRKENHLWRNISNKAERFYIPLLEAFKKELIRIDNENQGVVPPKLLMYLIGNNDFYKVIKKKNKIEINAFNLNGTLSKSIQKTKSSYSVNKLKLPTRIIEFIFKPNSKNTLILTFDEGWQISFRIHSASSKVESSLKFDINILGQPQSLYTHHLNF